ncbi:hypothetical protein D3C77_691760 [compost metagenome]
MVASRIGKQCHALLGTGHKQRFQVKIGAQALRAVGQFGFGIPAAHGLLHFRPIGGDERRAAIARIVVALGVHQHRDARMASHGHERFNARQHTLGVVG